MTLDEFDGTFAITDHNLVPSSLLNYLSERFYTATRFRSVKLEDINTALNEVWQGPGSLAHVHAETQRLRELRQATQTNTATSTEPVQTIDDFEGADFEYTHTRDSEEDDGTV